MLTLEVQMIVKNGGAGLARCLKSVQGIAQRITIGDTGSTDDTACIAARFGARVIQVPWQNDFAAARNCILAQADQDWILFLDADEMLDHQAAQQIPRLLADPNTAAYDVAAWNYVMDPGFRSSGEQAQPNPGLLPETSAYPAFCSSTNTRLFRRNAGIYFEHCVHETVADRLDILGLHRKSADFVIHHFGYVEDAAERRAQKESLYYDLALKKVARSCNSYEANLGAGIAELDHAKAPAAAVPYFKKALQLETRRATAWLYAGICLTRLGRNAEALAHLNRASKLDPSSSLAASSLGDVHLQSGDSASARKAYKTAIALGDASPLTLAKLGAAQVRLGECEAGIAKVEQAMILSPAAADLYDIYAPTAFLAGKTTAACEAANHRLSLESVTAFHFLLAATLHVHADRRSQAQALAESGAARFPNDPELKTLMRSLQAVGI